MLGGSQLALTPFSGELTPSFGFCRHLHAYGAHSTKEINNMHIVKNNENTPLKLGTTIQFMVAV